MHIYVYVRPLRCGSQGRPGAGRPRVIGARLPNLSTYVNESATPWTTLTLARWYAERDRPIPPLSGTAMWYHTGLPPVPIRWVLVRDHVAGSLRKPFYAPTSPPIRCRSSLGSSCGFQLGVTFREVRAHLGVETQRQWFDQVIACTTPALLGVFSLVTLLAHDLRCMGSALPCCQAAWYSKPLPTFADALALVRRHLWAHTTFPTSPADAALVKVPRALVEHDNVSAGGVNAG